MQEKASKEFGFIIFSAIVMGIAISLYRYFNPEGDEQSDLFQTEQSESDGLIN